MLRQVKNGFLLLLGLVWMAGAAVGADPSASQILREARLLQSEQHAGFVGRLRNADRVVPFRLFFEGNTIRYDFADRDLVLKLGESGARLEEQSSAGKTVIGPARFDKKVQDTDISYEDLSLRFLYWSNAVLLGEDSIGTQRCWRLQLKPGSHDESQYSRVDLWVDKRSRALLRADSYDWNGQFAKRFEVRKVQKIDNLWVLKQMRIQEMSGAGRDKTPTYLEIEGMLKPVGQ